tara:strand:+ start:155 stop:814 length:660 start_codon:yes stop_codon:yes gene_type:complete
MEKDKPIEVKYQVLQWGPCIVHLKISEEFQQKLLKGAEEARKQKKDFRSNLAGIIKEEYSYENRADYVDEIAQFLTVYDEAYQKFKNEKYKVKPEYLLNALWVNFMKKNEYNPPHDHSDYLSFVIFLKVPEEIKKEQEDFVGNSAGPGSLSFLYGDGNRQSITYQSVKPDERDIFIFPAWIKHYVAPFYSNVTRISVSGNISNSVLLNQIKPVNKNEGK